MAKYITKYILSGGYEGSAADGGKAFCEEIVKGLKEPLRIFICLYGLPREDWDEAFRSRQEFLKLHLGERAKCYYQVESDYFINTDGADVVFIEDGDWNLMSYWFNHYSEVISLLYGKVVVGSGIGADYLGVCTYLPDWRQTAGSSGIAQVRVLAHYQSQRYMANDSRGSVDWEAALEEVKSQGREQPLHALHDGEFVVIEQDDTVWVERYLASTRQSIKDDPQWQAQAHAEAMKRAS
jgi:hypothetical protein